VGGERTPKNNDEEPLRERFIRPIKYQVISRAFLLNNLAVCPREAMQEDDVDGATHNLISLLLFSYSGREGREVDARY
jgi:hypothetical protein